jgi:RNA-binding protein YlmH
MDEKEEFGALYARMEDLCLRAERGEASASSFLSPRELHYATRYLARKGSAFFAFGGYLGAERQKLFFVPDYVALSEDLLKNPDEALACAETMEEFGMEPQIGALRITGSGYRELTHRDFLGSLLGLGLERSVLGDVVVENEQGSCAVVFCEAHIADFIVENLLRVANDKVKVSRLERSSYVPPKRAFTAINDTVASSRLDGVVAALCGLSREKARDVVESGLVEINFEREERPDRTVTPPALISVRGVGRFRVLSLNDRTRKGRLRMEAEQFR